MSRTVKQDHANDSEAKASAIALLDAADDLGIPAGRIRTVTEGSRVGFSAPTEVYEESGLTGGQAAPDDPAFDPAGPNAGDLPEITAHFSVVVNGSSQQVYATVEPVPGDAQRVVSVIVNLSEPFDMMTGSTSVMVYSTNSPFASSSVELRDVETQSSVDSPISGAGGTALTLTLQPVA